MDRERLIARIRNEIAGTHITGSHVTAENVTYHDIARGIVVALEATNLVVFAEGAIEAPEKPTDERKPHRVGERPR